MTNEIRKFTAMEPVLNSINGSSVSLSREEERRNSEILKEILLLITNKLKVKNNLFKEMFVGIFYGGSYYDGLRVGKPDEFDLDLLMKLPRLAETTIVPCNKPGYINLKVDISKLKGQAVMAERCKGMDKLINEKQFLDTSKVLRWMESVLTQTLNEFEKRNNMIVFPITYGEFLVKRYRPRYTSRSGRRFWYPSQHHPVPAQHVRTQKSFQAKIHKGGPAFTLKVQTPIKMDIDLVPCFRMNPEQRKPNFFIVPKPLKNIPNSSHYWRLSFQEQERIIIDGKKTLKPTIKLMKKLRDTQRHKCIASYYIKTIAIWMATEKEASFWNNPLSYVFLTFLKEYYNCLSIGKIRYFWNKNYNLIQCIQTETIKNVANRIKAIIDDIERNPDNGTVVEKYL